MNDVETQMVLKTNGTWTWTFSSSLFASQKDFNEFYRIALDLIKTLHKEGSAITKVELHEVKTVKSEDV